MKIHFSKEDIYDIIVNVYFKEMGGETYIKENWEISWEMGNYESKLKKEK